MSLEHISCEEIIREAGVARSAAYRRWPYKDLFLSDLVRELARQAAPLAIAAAEYELIRRIAAARPDRLETPEGRLDLLGELFREVAMLDFETLLGSTRWRTYVALHATFMSIDDHEVREQVQAALAESERELLARVALAWERLAGQFGYRLRAGNAVTFEALIILLGAMMRGLVIMAPATPLVASYQAIASPFGLTSTAEWSLPALGVVAAAFLEPDPAVEWDDRRVAEVRRALAAGDPPGA